MRAVIVDIGHSGPPVITASTALVGRAGCRLHRAAGRSVNEPCQGVEHITVGLAAVKAQDLFKCPQRLIGAVGGLVSQCFGHSLPPAFRHKVIAIHKCPYLKSWHRSKARWAPAPSSVRAGALRASERLRMVVARIVPSAARGECSRLRWLAWPLRADPSSVPWLSARRRRTGT